MKVSSSRLFTYPVLWFVNDDYVDSDFSISIESRQQFKKLEIDYEILLENDGLESFIDQGKALYCIHIENSVTTLRRKFLTRDKKGTLKIDEEDINQQIDVSTFIIATEDIEKYTNKMLNSDYEGATFNINKGSILAIADYISIDIDKSQNDLGRKDSIFTVSKGINCELMEFEIENDRIIIKLPEEDFNRLQSLQGGPTARDIIYSIFIVPALIFVFETLARSETEDMERYSEYLWFKSLEKILNENNIDLNPETINTKTSYTLAQKLIGQPISKALRAIGEREDEDEDILAFA